MGKDVRATVPVSVNLDGLSTFRTFLSQELQHTLEPTGTKVIDGHNLGIGFGPTTRSMQVSMAQLTYSEQLSTSCDNMTRYIQFVQVLIDSIQLIIDRYADSDMTADDMMNLLQAKLNLAEAPDPYFGAL
jgi:hypothetical protein